MNKEPVANTTLSHYKIVSKIGAGGMGEVYLAQDTKLDRKVALKILPVKLTQQAREGSFWLFLIRVDPQFEPLRGDPRFQELLKRFDPPQ